MMRFKAWYLTILLMIPLLMQSQSAFSKTFRIVQISDTHIGKSHEEYVEKLRAVIGEINSSPTRPDFVLCTGDYTNAGTTDQYELFMKLISKLKFPVYYAIGNHEVKWSQWGKTGITHFFHQKLYYSFNHKGIHFVSLDSTIWLDHNSFIDSLELDWLKKDLRRTGTKRPVVLFYHHCPNYVLNEPALLDVLKPYNVKLALVGHEHAWGTYVRNGVAFQLDCNCYAGNGTYRIVDFNDSDIKSYRKEVGKEAVADGDFQLSPAENPVRLISPKSDEHLNGDFEAVAESEVPMEKFEIAIDGRYKPAVESADGRYHADFGGDIVPGHHIITARGTNSAGEWLQSVSVTIGDISREAWRFHTKGAVQRSVAVDNGRLYFGCIGGNVYCLDAATGNEIWRTNVGSDVLSKICVDNGNLFFGDAGGDLIAMSADTGKKVWTVKFASAVLGSPVVEKGIVYTGAGDESVCAVDAKTGSVLWKTPTGGMVQVSPLVFQDKVFFGNWDKRFFCLDARTGKILWTNKVGVWTGYSPACSNPASDGRNVFYTFFPVYPKDPDLACIDPETGKTVWSCQTAPEENGCAQSSPLVMGGELFVETATGYIVRLSAYDGKEIWRSAIGQQASTNAPIDIDGKLIVCGNTGMLVLLDAKTGQRLWSYSSGDGYVYGSPAYWRGNIYMSSLDGSVTCIREDPQK